MSEELDAIKSVLNQQVSTLWDYKKAIGKSNSSLDLCHNVLDRMLAQSARRLDEFNELQLQADTAREWVRFGCLLVVSIEGRSLPADQLCPGGTINLSQSRIKWQSDPNIHRGDHRLPTAIIRCQLPWYKHC